MSREGVLFLVRSRVTLAATVALIGAATCLAASPEESAFMAENEAAMKTMMAAMAITPTGDVDRDFVAMMVPHHQGAIDMARAELRHGRNEQLRRLAQEIVVEQLQQIEAMRLALGERHPGSGTMPDSDAAPPSPHAHRSGVVP